MVGHTKSDKKKLKICRRTPGFGVILLLIFTRLRQVCKWVSLYCHLNSISRQELGEIIRGGDTETTALGKRKQKNPKSPLIILLPVLTSSIPVSVLKLRFSLSCDTHRLGKDCQVCINGYRAVRTMIIGVHHNQHSGHKQS